MWFNDCVLKWLLFWKTTDTTYIYIYHILTQYIPGMFQLSTWSGIHWDIMYDICMSKQPYMCHAQDTGLMFLQKVITIPLVIGDTIYLYTIYLLYTHEEESPLMVGWVADITCFNHGSPEDPEKKGDDTKRHGDSTLPKLAWIPFNII